MFGPSESEPSQVGIGPIYSGMIWSGLLGDGDADADADAYSPCSLELI